MAEVAPGSVRSCVFASASGTHCILPAAAYLAVSELVHLCTMTPPRDHCSFATFRMNVVFPVYSCRPLASTWPHSYGRLCDTAVFSLCLMHMKRSHASRCSVSF